MTSNEQINNKFISQTFQQKTFPSGTKRGEEGTESDHLNIFLEKRE